MSDTAASDHLPYRTRTSVLFAASAPKAVILRRGPRTHYHLIAWDLTNHTFQHGQWIKGNVRLADLSLRGGKLLYFAEQYGRLARTVQGAYEPLKQRPTLKIVQAGRQHRRVPRYLGGGSAGTKRLHRPLRDGWTAISTPPYFSALAIWPSFGRWTGGGVFAGERDLLLNETEDGMTPIENVPMPRDWRVRLLRRADGARACAYAATVDETERHRRVASVLLGCGLEWVDWIDLRHAEDMLFAGDGRICRLRGWRSRPEPTYLSAAEPLIDLRDMAFRQLRPPEDAMRW
jgi:hypothetical protein